MRTRLLFPLVLLLGACGGQSGQQPAAPAASATDATATATTPAAEPVAATATDGDCALNLFIWSEYIDPEIVSDFEKQHNCKVTIDLYEDNEAMIAKLQGGGDSLYDVVVPGNYVIPAMIKLGLLAELRKENIPNLANLDPNFASPEYDPGNKYSVAYQWGTVGIYARKKDGKSPPHTWAILFDKDKSYGSFLLMDSYREMMGSALRYKGWSVNTPSADQLKQIRTLLSDAKNRSQGFEGGVGGKNKVLGKVVDAAVVYNGDAVRGIADDPDTEYFVPDEGGVLWIDNLAVPAKAPHRDVAEKFINFILDPQVGARLSNYNQYATPNKAAKAFITPADLANSAIYPPEEQMSKLQAVVDLGDDEKMYSEVWTQVRSE